SAGGLLSPDVLSWLHPPKQPLDHLRRAFRSSQVAELDSRHLARRIDDVEPDHLAGFEVDERGIVKLFRAADVRRAKANDASGKAQHAECNPAPRRDLVLRVEEESIVVAALLPQPHGI